MDGEDPGRFIYLIAIRNKIAEWMHLLLVGKNDGK